MRFGLAIASLVLAGVLLLLGIGQRTFLAGPASVTSSAPMSAETGLAVIPGDAFSGVPGQANVVVTGNAAFAATGADRDVRAWLEPFDHQQFDVDAGERELRVTAQPGVPIPEADAEDAAESGNEETDASSENTDTSGGEAQEIPDPRGSDLWLTERASDPVADEGSADAAEDATETPAADPGEVRLPVSVEADDAVLVSVEPGTEASVELVWVQDRRTPLAGPLLVAGGFFALLGLVLYLLAVDHDRRGLGPRRGRRGPLLGIRDALRRPARRGDSSPPPTAQRVSAGPESAARRGRAALPALGIVLAVGLTGCAPSYWPEFGEAPDPVVLEAEEEQSGLATVPVTRVQIERIIQDVAEVAGAADETLDADLLEERFSSDALRQREANYTIRADVPEYPVVPPRLTDELLGYELVQSTEGWPRTMLVIVASEPAEEPAEAEAEDAEATAEDEAETPPASPSVALLLTQETPHENFSVTRAVSLRGGITMPEAAPAEEGTAILSNDLQTLVLPPGEVGSAYASVLAGGQGVDEAALFDLEGDTLIERSGASWAAQSRATAEENEQDVQYSVTAEQSDSKIISLSTGVGGALVATTIIENRIEEPGSERWKPTPPPSVTALSGLSGQQDRLVSEVSHQLLFFVPSATSDGPIQLLGFTSDLIGARN